MVEQDGSIGGVLWRQQLRPGELSLRGGGGAWQLRHYCVAMGPIQTGYIPAHVEGDLAGKVPPGRIGQTEDVADAIVLLASEQARWITGQKIYVDGGNTMRL